MGCAPGPAQPIGYVVVLSVSGLESCDFSCDFSVILVSKGLKRGRQGGTSRITVILSDASDFSVILATVTQKIKSLQKSPAFFCRFQEHSKNH